MFRECSLNVPGMGRPSGVFVQRARDRVPGVLDPHRQLARRRRVQHIALKLNASVAQAVFRFAIQVVLIEIN
jgi:hypothetical protein